MRRGLRAQLGGILVGLVALALLAGNASPGFPLAGAVGRTLARALGPAHAAPGTTPQVPGAPDLRASTLALSDIPLRYLELYATAAHTCPPLTWQLLAGIGKVESDHGRDPGSGVQSGTNSAGAAGPMQFLLPTWAIYGHGDVYDPADAIPASARMLCGDGLQDPTAQAHDPCPTLLGSAASHLAVHRYNHACWYVHEVLTWANRYTQAPPPAPPTDPFQAALARNPHITTTTSRGCNPAPDLVDPRLDLRVQSILAALADRWAIRVSCVHTGHSYYVQGTHRVSNHTVWRAVDIDQVDGQPVGPSSTRARALAQWLDGLEGPLRPVEVGSPWDFGHRPYFTDEGHQGHIHIGYGP